MSKSIIAIKVAPSSLQLDEQFSLSPILAVKQFEDKWPIFIQ